MAPAATRPMVSRADDLPPPATCKTSQINMPSGQQCAAKAVSCRSLTVALTVTHAGWASLCCEAFLWDG